MSYIKRLQRELAEAQGRAAGYEQGLREIESYLLLPKFREDTTVQRGDIFARIADARVLANEGESEAGAAWDDTEKSIEGSKISVDPAQHSG